MQVHTLIRNKKPTNSIDKTVLLKPMLAKIKEFPFDDDEWVFETKYDGYRALALCDGRGKVSLYSRNLMSFNSNYPGIVEELKKMPHHCILDGEVVVEDGKGLSNFQHLQNYRTAKDYTLKYYVFDLLNLDGKDLTNLPLLARKELLQLLLHKTKMKNVIYSEHIVGKGISLYKKAIKNKWEGIMAKNAKSPYRVDSRSSEWLKIKIVNEQEAIICGITEPKGSRSYFGAILLGVYENGKLEYIGKIGTGFDERTLKELFHDFKPSFINKSPFDKELRLRDTIQWMKPKFICQVKFTEWTKDGSMRHPVFMGLRRDLNPKNVAREKIFMNESESINKD
jgi:bifunctional non-homologous end joining protein LigD